MRRYQASIRLLLAITTICAGFFAAYRIGSSQLLTIYAATLYSMLPTVIHFSGTRRLSDDWTLFVVPAVVTTVAVLCCSPWIGFTLALAIVNLSVVTTWPLLLYFIAGNRDKTSSLIVVLHRRKSRQNEFLRCENGVIQCGSGKVTLTG